MSLYPRGDGLMVQLVLNATKILSSNPMVSQVKTIYTHPWHETWLGVMPTTCQSSLLLCSWEAGGKKRKNLYKLQLVRPTKWGMPPELDTCLGSSLAVGPYLGKCLPPRASPYTPPNGEMLLQQQRLGLLVLLDPFWFESSFTNCV
jgi:hypothetical protein